MTALALLSSELPVALAESAGLVAHARGDDREFRFDRRDRPARLPVWLDGRLRMARWGNFDGADPDLPATGWTWHATVREGRWRSLGPEPVTVPATYLLAGGVWTRLKLGVRGLVVPDRLGDPVAYVVCEPATRYYRVMTRCRWMPVLIGEVI